MNELTTTNLALELNDKALQALTDQRNMLKKFIEKQLTKDVDYGIIPGTPKPTLYKPGAEKLTNIFKLGSKIIKNEKTIDRQGNYAQIDVTIEVYHIPTGKSMATCEGIANSHETKNRMRTKYEWINGVKTKVAEVETPIGDLLNTLTKMSQKRAFVGAVILATNASDFFTQDLEDMPDMNFEKDVTPKPQAEPLKDDELKNWVMTHGNKNVKGKKLGDIDQKDLWGAIDFFTANGTKQPSGAVAIAVSNAKKFLDLSKGSPDLQN